MDIGTSRTGGSVAVGTRHKDWLRVEGRGIRNLAVNVGHSYYGAERHVDECGSTWFVGRAESKLDEGCRAELEG